MSIDNSANNPPPQPNRERNIPEDVQHAFNRFATRVHYGMQVFDMSHFATNMEAKYLRTTQTHAEYGYQSYERAYWTYKRVSPLATGITVESGIQFHLADSISVAKAKDHPYVSSVSISRNRESNDLPIPASKLYVNKDENSVTLDIYEPATTSPDYQDHVALSYRGGILRTCAFYEDTVSRSNQPRTIGAGRTVAYLSEEQLATMFQGDTVNVKNSNTVKGERKGEMFSITLSDPHGNILQTITAPYQQNAAQLMGQLLDTEDYDDYFKAPQPDLWRNYHFPTLLNTRWVRS